MPLKLTTTVLCVMVTTAFFTLLEHKLLGHLQMRVGPNSMGPGGILQAITDFLKLLNKESMYPFKMNLQLFTLAPMITITASITIWLSTNSPTSPTNTTVSMLFILCCLSINTYSPMLAGWTSFSKYSLMGGLRIISQIITYEVIFTLVMASILIPSSTLHLSNSNLQTSMFTFIALLPMLPVWVIICLSETNRAPFDFGEAESELVSGFNTEYGSSMFILLFLAEYMSILFLSALTTLLIFYSDFLSLNFPLITIFVAFLIIWTRGSLPRLRYDMAMQLAWKPLSILSLITIMSTSSMKLITL